MSKINKLTLDLENNVAIAEGVFDKYALDNHLDILVTHGPPKKFKLGSGHVLFFKDKLGYIYNRYLKLYEDCKNRGFNVTDMRDSFDGFDLTGQYDPSDSDRQLILDRIQERIDNMKRVTYTKY